MIQELGHPIEQRSSECQKISRCTNALYNGRNKATEIFSVDLPKTRHSSESQEGKAKCILKLIVWLFLDD